MLTPTLQHLSPHLTFLQCNKELSLISCSNSSHSRLYFHSPRITASLYIYIYLLAVLGRAPHRFGVFFIKNQCFSFLRMHNELLLRSALCTDWRLGPRHHSQRQDFHKDIYDLSQHGCTFFCRSIRVHITICPINNMSFTATAGKTQTFGNNLEH